MVMALLGFIVERGAGRDASVGVPFLGVVDEPGGGADVSASFKIVGLDKILGAPPLADLNLLDQVDRDWEPRA
jgi:hypothetical protein